MALQRTLEPTSKVRDLEFFLSSIQDPHNPRHCAVCLDGAFRECTELQPSLQNRKNRNGGVPKDNPELWNATFKLLFVKRSNEQMVQFLTRLLECTCRMDEESGNVRRYHQSRIQIPKKKNEDQTRSYKGYYELHASPERQRLTKAWHPFLSNVLKSLSGLIEHSGSKSCAKGSSTSWPHNSTDLIPYGADTLVESLIQWHHFVPDPLFFRLMGNIIKVCRELVIPSLAKYKFTKMVVESTKKSLDRMILDHGEITYPDSNLIVYPLSVPLGLSQVMAPIFLNHQSYSNKRRKVEFCGDAWLWQIEDTMQYLATCLFTIYHDDYKGALYQDCKIKAMQLCSLILYMFYPLQNAKRIPQVNFPTLTDGLVRIGQELFRFFHMHRPSQPSIRVHPFIKDLDDYMHPLDLLCAELRMTVSHSLLMFRMDMRCSALGCMNSLQSAGNDLKRCSKCEIVNYCGPDCQMKAWKDEIHPHKLLCPILTKLVGKAGGYGVFLACTKGSADSKANKRATKLVRSKWDKAEIDEDDLKRVADWQDAINASRRSTPVDLYKKELSPGFVDYENILPLLSNNDRAPEPVYLDRRSSA